MAKLHSTQLVPQRLLQKSLHFIIILITKLWLRFQEMKMIRGKEIIGRLIPTAKKCLTMATFGKFFVKWILSTTELSFIFSPLSFLLSVFPADLFCPRAGLPRKRFLPKISVGALFLTVETHSREFSVNTKFEHSSDWRFPCFGVNAPRTNPIRTGADQTTGLTSSDYNFTFSLSRTGAESPCQNPPYACFRSLMPF